MIARKKPSKKHDSTQVEVHKIGRVLVFEPEFREDIGWWYKNEPQKAFKVFDIVEDVLRTPFKSIGKPEPLNYLDSDTLSRCIDLDHRVVYRVTRDRIDFFQARYHYE